jgi:hypothetical protein
MNLNLSAVFQPDADLVYVNFSSTDAGSNLIIADQVTFNLYQQTSNLIGTTQNNLLTSLSVTSQFARPEQDYEITFLHPLRRMDLLVEAVATFGSTVVSKIVQVGQAANPESTILPDNAIWEFDPLDVIPTQGGSDDLANHNIIIAAPELQNYVEKFDFSVSTGGEEYNLSYAGGGNRLLMQNQTNQFVLQKLDQAAWTVPAYLFMENEATNLLPNNFFINSSASGTLQVPNGWKVEEAGSSTLSSVAFDHATSSDAMIWTLQFIQNTAYFQANNATITLAAPVAVVPSQAYVFSSYLQALALNLTTNINTFLMEVTWLDSAQLVITKQAAQFPFGNYVGLSLAALPVTSPANAAFANVSLMMPSNGGTNVQLNILSPQFEIGKCATSRILGTRQQDQLTLPAVDPSNQKMRLGIIMGFDSSSVVSSVPMTSGPVVLSVEPGNLVKVTVTGIGSCEVPLSFGVGDYLDLTVQSEAGGNISIYQAGQLLGSAPLSTFAPNPAPLTILGVGFELLTLSVFSRS